MISCQPGAFRHGLLLCTTVSSALSLAFLELSTAYTLDRLTGFCAVLETREVLVLLSVWAAVAALLLLAIMSVLGPVPDVLIFQTWQLRGRDGMLCVVRRSYEPSSVYHTCFSHHRGGARHAPSAPCAGL